MRVLIVSQYFWPESFPINSLALGLHERGHSVTVLTAIPNYPSGRFFRGYGYFRKVREDYGGIKVLRVPLVPRGGGGNVRLAINYLSFALSSSLLAPLVCRGKYDLIFVWESSPVTIGLPALILKWMKSVPIMFWVQDLWPDSLAATGAVKSSLVLRLVDDLVRFIYRGCDRVLVQSMAFSPLVETQGVDPRRILYFPNCVEEFYRPVDVEPGATERKEMPDGFRILFAGNIGAAQDFGTILAAAERLKDHPDIHWVIMGDGRMRSWVEDEIQKRELGRTVHLLERRPAKAMPRYFSLVDVLLVTLRKEPIFALTIPTKVQSYLACARPILAALEGEGARIIEEAGAGFSVTPEDPEALAKAALAFYRTPETERSAMGLRGRKYSESHFERRMLLDLLECWMNDLRGEVPGCASGREG